MPIFIGNHFKLPDHINRIALTDAKFIKKLKKRNKDAFQELYEQYAGKMRFLCLRYIKDLNEVDDITQDAFLKVYLKINTYKETGSFEAWMKKIYINTALKHLEKKGKQKVFSEQPDEIALNSYSNNEGFKPDNDLDDNTDLSENELIARAKFSVDEILASAETLPDHFRVVFNMYSVDCLKHQEIAEILQISENTSKTRLLRARKLMQSELLKRAKEKLNIS